MVNLPIEESIRQLKSEIIAQDWRISPKRAEMLEKSLSFLQQHFTDKKATHAMLNMALSVLEYVKNNKGAPPETIDFLKESMAHVVEQYENLKYDKQDEEKVFAALFCHFNRLKKQIKQESKPAKNPVVSKQPPAKASHQKTDGETIPPEIALKKIDDTGKLLKDLNITLQNAGEAGSTIKDLLNKLLARKAFSELTSSLNCLPRHEEDAEGADHPTSSLNGNQQDLPVETRPYKQPLNNCPPTNCQQIIIGKTKLAILTQCIATHKTINKKRLNLYLNDAKVPLTYFSRPFSGLSRQFKGPLAKISSRKLKKIILPIIFPKGIDMAETAEYGACQLLVVSNGNWHGIIVCSGVDQHPCNMVKFIKEHNGDITGIGYIEDNTKISLLDSAAILKREGFLLMP